MLLSEKTLNFVSYASIAGSIASILLGISWVIYGFTTIVMAPQYCSFERCNEQWRAWISFAPETFVDTFQPIILGVIGVVYHLPSRPLKPAFMGPPSSSVGGGFFHIVMALFGNLGYMYWVGITVCTYNLLIGSIIVILSIIQNEGGISSTRPKDLDEIPETSMNTIVDITPNQAPVTQPVVAV